MLTLVLCACSLPGLAAGTGRSKSAIEADLKFGAEMARQGLWHEALFRWERVVPDRPDDARLWNNIAVAAEALGRFDRAREAYEKAASLSNDRKIASNWQLFMRAHKPPEKSGAGESGTGAPPVADPDGTSVPLPPPAAVPPKPDGTGVPPGGK